MMRVVLPTVTFAAALLADTALSEKTPVAIGSAFIIGAALVAGAWRVRGIFDKYNDAINGLKDEVKALKEGVAALPCHRYPLCNPNKEPQ